MQAYVSQTFFDGIPTEMIALLKKGQVFDFTFFDLLTRRVHEKTQ